MKPRERKPQRVLVPLDNDRRRGIYLSQNGARGGTASVTVYTLTDRQRRRLRKAENRAKLAAERSVTS